MNSSRGIRFLHARAIDEWPKSPKSLQPKEQDIKYKANNPLAQVWAVAMVDDQGRYDPVTEAERLCQVRPFYAYGVDVDALFAAFEWRGYKGPRVKRPKIREDMFFEHTQTGKGMLFVSGKRSEQWPAWQTQSDWDTKWFASHPKSKIWAIGMTLNTSDQELSSQEILGHRLTAQQRALIRPRYVYCEVDEKTGGPVRGDMLMFCAKMLLSSNSIKGPRHIGRLSVIPFTKVYDFHHTIVAVRVIAQRDDWLSVDFAAAACEKHARNLLSYRPLTTLVKKSELTGEFMLKQVEVLGHHN